MKMLSGLRTGIIVIALLAASEGAVCAGAAMNSAVLQANNSISGIVFDSSRRPVADLWVELQDEVNTVLKRTRTDGSGRYGFYGISLGIFQVSVVATGTDYVGQTKRVSLVPVFGGGQMQREEVDFYLASKSGTTGPTVSGITFAQEVPEAARKAYEQGISLLEGGKDVEGGVGHLKEAVDLFPTYYMALERLGVEYVRQGRHEPALDVLGKAVEINPKGYDSYYALGVAQFRLRSYGESAESLKKMVGLAPRSSNASFGYYFLGLALLRGGKPSEAEPHLKQAYDMGGKGVPSDVHMALAQIYSNSKRYKQAISELELFLKEAPDASDAEKIRAIIKQLRSKS